MSRSALSPVQETVMSLKAQGLGIKKIAEKLGLSKSTVKTHLKRAQARISKPRDTEALPDDGLQEILKELEPECSLTLKVETLARRGLSPSIIAQITGATQGTVRQILHRQKQKERRKGYRENAGENERGGKNGRERARTYRLEWEEWQSYKKQTQKDQLPKDEISFLYKIYVQIGLDNLTPEALALLGTQGLGGWRGRKAVFQVRKEMTHRLALSGRVAANQWNSRKVAEEMREMYGVQDDPASTPSLEEPFRPRTSGGTIKPRKGNIWWALCEDLLEGARRAGGIYQPGSWTLFAEEMAGRVKEALSGLMIENLGQRGEHAVYRVYLARTPAVAVRTAPQGTATVELVWEVSQVKKKGNRKNETGPKGTVIPMAGNKVTLIDGENKTVINRPAGITFSSRGKRWIATNLETGSSRLLRRGDVVEMEGGIARVVKWESEEHNLKVVEFSGWDLAWAIAAYVMRRPCWLIVERPGEPVKEWDFRDLESRLAA